MAEQLALHLSIDQAGAYLVAVHGLGHQRIALRPVIAALGDEPDAHGIAAGHQPEAVVLDLVNPIGAGRGLVGWGLGRGHEPAPVVPACASVRLPKPC